MIVWKKYYAPPWCLEEHFDIPKYDLIDISNQFSWNLRLSLWSKKQQRLSTLHLKVDMITIYTLVVTSCMKYYFKHLKAVRTK